MLTIGNAALLLLAPLGVVAVVAVAQRSTRPLSRARRLASLAVRSLIVLMLALALGRPALTRRAELPRFTAFLLDLSESIPQAAAQEALRELKPLWDREVGAGHRCALVAFAGRARVRIPPTDRPLETAGLASREGLESGATNLARGVETARALFREEAANRIVLLTDGRDTTRPARHVELPHGTRAVRLVPPDRRDVAIVQVHAPLAVRAGEPFDLRVTLDASHETEVGLSVVVNGMSVPEAAGRFRLASPGLHSLVLPNLQQKKALSPGLHRLDIIAQAAGDAEPRNNVWSAAVTATDVPRVLLVEGTPGEGEFLARVFKAQGIDFARQAPAELASRAASLDEFVAVVLAGVGRDALPPAALSQLKTFVERDGGGLWAVGSPSLQGPRGYAGSELEKLLPVTFPEAPAVSVAPRPPDAPVKPPPPAPQPLDAPGVPQRVIAPTVALLLVVDKSGSMAGDNIALVKTSCLATAEALSKRDLLGVLAFDAKPRWLLEFTEAERFDYIKERVLRLFADGGTHIHPALVEAHRAFQADPRARRCAAKHVVLLSDGDTPPADFETVVRKMAEDGITVSTVCVAAAKFDPQLMSQIASWGGGRFKFTNSFKNVPQLIVQDVTRVLETLPKDAPATPAAPPKETDRPPPPVKPPPDKPEEPPPLEALSMRDPHEALQGIEARALPGIRGRLPAVARPKSEVLLETAGRHPVLALGRVGLGKTAVWTSDLAGTWTSEFLAWKDSGKLIAQVARFISGPGPDAELAGRVRLSRDQGRPVIRVDAGGDLRVTDPATGTALASTVDAEGAGVFALPADLQQVTLHRADGRKLLLGLSASYDEEFAPAPPERDLFAGAVAPVSWQELERNLADARMSAERRSDLALWLIVAVLMLLPLDVALRRFNA